MAVTAMKRMDQPGTISDQDLAWNKPITVTARFAV
jgi:hypothetical protein